MNSALIGLVTVVWLLLGYRFYGRFIASLIAVLPACMLVATGSSALVFQAFRFLYAYDLKAGPNWLLGAIALILLLLAAVVARDAVVRLRHPWAPREKRGHS